MEHTFQAGVQTMLHAGLLDPDAARKDLLARGPNLNEGSSLVTRARKTNVEEGDLMRFLADLIGAFPYLGANGLKDRTGLEEHRYDAA
jgi:hypothetical protein